MKTKPDGYWNNKENVFKAAKKYKTRKEFDRGCCGAYKVAWKNGWLDEMDWLSKKWNRKWNRETVFEEAKKYQTRTEFSKSSFGAYENARQNGWLNELFPKHHSH